jgi:AAA+ superfamily predicted ATPase
MTATQVWAVQNQRYLELALLRVQARLQLMLQSPVDVAAIDREFLAVRSEMAAPSAFEQLCEAFQLSEFEAEVLLLCAAMEVLPRFGDLCAACQQDPLLSFPTFGLALAVLPSPAWTAITPVAGLRKLKLVEMEGGHALVRNRIRISERVLHFLLGLDYVDSSLGFVIACESGSEEPDPAALKIRDLTFAMVGRQAAPVEIVGLEAEAIFVQAAAAIGLQPFKVNASDLPRDVEEFCRIWSREALLTSGALYISHPDANLAAVRELCQRAAFPLYIGTQEPLQIEGSVLFHLESRETVDIRNYWTRALSGRIEVSENQLAMLADTFRLSPQTIRTVTDSVANGNATPEDLWHACRLSSRKKLDQLAARIESKMKWDDLVLSDDQKQILAEVVAHVRNRNQVYSEWGFGERNTRGLGISALFSGPSGTGKTLSAEVIAGELNLDLYEIDLSQLVSKYIGETEKNLRQIFAAAEESGGVLVFNEADAVFGQRSEVRDSHDRFANMGVSYLLQLTESYRGLVILTTNMRQAMDQAFMRRIRFVVNFQFPEYDQRYLLWKRVFPSRVPLADLDLDWLAKINLTGGQIRSIAMNAAFRAADEGQAVAMPHIVAGIQNEFVKLDRPMSEHEMGGAAWL